uniref:Uncharacterized protein n=1 Tax=Opuntia streptacantha TaxID=393608 RepID=A0A7C9CYM4_OPUST
MLSCLRAGDCLGRSANRAPFRTKAWWAKSWLDMKMTEREPTGTLTIGPCLEKRLLSAASISVDDLRSHLIPLIMGTAGGPGGSFNLGFKERKAFSKAARQAVTIIRNQASIFSCSLLDFLISPLCISIYSIFCS